MSKNIIHYAPADWKFTACGVKVTGTPAPVVTSDHLSVTCDRCKARV